MAYLYVLIIALSLFLIFTNAKSFGEALGIVAAIVGICFIGPAIFYYIFPMF